MDIGRRSLLDVIFSAFEIAQIRAIFQGDGNSCFDMQLFMICARVRGDTHCSATILMYLTGIQSGPHEQPVRKLLISDKTSR
jgi:hypothetical protein